MSALANEIQSIDFDNMLGGPLSAVVEAQASSAITTADFIQSVGFNEAAAPDQPQTVKTVDFKFKKYDEEAGQDTTVTLTVPVLSILPVPFIRVADTDIKFKAHLNSVHESSVDLTNKWGASVEGKFGFWRVKGSFKAKYSYSKTTKTNTVVTRDYAMNIHIKAVQEEMPAGMSKVLDILETAIKETEEENP